jgi:hypothetical protein
MRSGLALGMTLNWPVLGKYRADGASVGDPVVTATAAPRRLADFFEKPVADEHAQIREPYRMTGLLLELLKYPRASEIPSIGFAALGDHQSSFQNGNPLGTFFRERGHGSTHLSLVHW